jgi:hypothetical protein
MRNASENKPKDGLRSYRGVLRLHHGVGADWSVPTLLVITSFLEKLSRDRNLVENNPNAFNPLVNRLF